MRWVVIVVLTLAAVGCGPVQQRESTKYVAAFEVPLPLESDQIVFLVVLSRLAKAEGMHVDAADTAELALLSRMDGGQRTMWAAIYGDQNDHESIATMMDWVGRPGRIWIIFSRGQNVERATRFRENAIREIKSRWPKTLSIPVLESGGVPLPQDLELTPDGYVISRSKAWQYEGKSKQPGGND